MKARTKVEIVSLRAQKRKMQYSLTLRRVEITFLAISTIWHWQKNNWSEKEIFLQLLVTKTYLSEVGKDFFLNVVKIRSPRRFPGSLSGRPSKGKGKGIRARHHARPNSPLPFSF